MVLRNGFNATGNRGLNYSGGNSSAKYRNVVPASRSKNKPRVARKLQPVILIDLRERWFPDYRSGSCKLLYNLIEPRPGCNLYNALGGSTGFADMPAARRVSAKFFSQPDNEVARDCDRAHADPVAPRPRELPEIRINKRPARTARNWDPANDARSAERLESCDPFIKRGRGRSRGISKKTSGLRNR